MTIRTLVGILMFVDDEAWDNEIMMVPGRGGSRSLGPITGVLGHEDVPGGPGNEDVTGWYLLITEKHEDSVQEVDEDGI